jgi:hypothetical protein
MDILVERDGCLLEKKRASRSTLNIKRKMVIVLMVMIVILIILT